MAQINFDKIETELTSQSKTHPWIARHIHIYHGIRDIFLAAGDGPESVEIASVAIADLIAKSVCDDEEDEDDDRHRLAEKDADADSEKEWYPPVDYAAWYIMIRFLVGELMPGHPWHSALARAVGELERFGIDERREGGKMWKGMYSLRVLVVDFFDGWFPSPDEEDTTSPSLRLTKLRTWKSLIAWMSQLPVSLRLTSHALYTIEDSILERFPSDDDPDGDDARLWGVLEWFICRSDALLELMSPSPEEIISETDAKYPHSRIPERHKMIGPRCRDKVSYPYCRARWEFWKRRLADMAEEEYVFDPEKTQRIAKALEAMEAAEDRLELKKTGAPLAEQGVELDTGGKGRDLEAGEELLFTLDTDDLGGRSMLYAMPGVVGKQMVLG
ncbi:hypothetical protein QBC47DRAFT_430403 [Echria macrotheca]|uniref:Uncharacterized protein n=1 Tax=Echria macrotheca TaxID=438768 RepID=A0AAJ0B8G1_9PEZI|nr:hypothetical protein QBC47DRAFT_430403 [Echria macrotheca]